MSAATTITVTPEVKRDLATQKPDTVSWNAYFQILQESVDPKRFQEVLEAYLKAEYDASLAAARQRYAAARDRPHALLSADDARAKVRRLRAKSGGANADDVGGRAKPRRRSSPRKGH